jgi:hypothetical protein
MKQISPRCLTLGALLALGSVGIAASAQSPPGATPQGGRPDQPQRRDPNAGFRGNQPQAGPQGIPGLQLGGDPNQFFPGGPQNPDFGPGVPFGPMIPPTPEMGKKTMEIMALREMLRIRLTAKDIAASLPPLHELREAEKTLQSRSDRILEEEKRALLAASPDEAPPLESGDKMRQAIETYGNIQEKTWSTITRSIGPEKANGLRRLLGMGGVPMQGLPGRNGDPKFAPGPNDQIGFPRRDSGLSPTPNGLPRRDSALPYDPNGTPRFRGGDATPVPGGRPGVPGRNVPVRPAPEGGQDVAPPIVLPPGTPDGNPLRTPVPSIPPGPEAGGNPVQLPLPAGDTAGIEPIGQQPPPTGDDIGSEPRRFTPQNPVGQPRGGRQQGGQPDRFRPFQPFPQGDGFFAPSPSGMSPFLTPRLTLAELISLLEQKQAAMRK